MDTRTRITNFSKMNNAPTPETDALANRLMPIAENITPSTAQAIITQVITEVLMLATKMERERNTARAKFAAAIDGRDMANEEADKLREQNAKLRDIADALAVALERLDVLYRSEQDPEAPMPRPDWLRRPLQMLDAELDQRKEGAK